MAVRLEAHPRGVVLPVRARPSARRNALCGEHAGALKVAVTQAAERGKANQAIIDLLSQTLGIARSRIELLSGAAASQKRFLILGATVNELAAALAAAQAGPS